eukprot:335929_1
MNTNSYTYPLIALIMYLKRKNPKLTLFSIGLLLYWSYKKMKQMINRPKSVKNRIILITGGVSGIGRLTALLLKLKEAIVIVWDVNEVGLREMEELVDCSMKVDISCTAQVDAGAKFVFNKYGHVDILINNAGIANGKPLLQLNTKQIESNFAVNVFSHFWTVQAFLPKMIERRSGHIVTIASSTSIQGVSQLVDYSAANAASRAFHHTLKLELMEQNLKDGISLSCINPYFTNTKMFDGTVTTNWWILKKLGYVFLNQEYVATEIIRAIEYDIPELFLPESHKVIKLLLELFVPDSITDYLMAHSGCEIKTS